MDSYAILWRRVNDCTIEYFACSISSQFDLLFNNNKKATNIYLLFSICSDVRWSVSMRAIGIGKILFAQFYEFHLIFSASDFLFDPPIHHTKLILPDIQHLGASTTEIGKVYHLYVVSVVFHLCFRCSCFLCTVIPSVLRQWLTYCIWFLFCFYRELCWRPTVCQHTIHCCCWCICMFSSNILRTSKTNKLNINVFSSFSIFRFTIPHRIR